MVRHICPDEMIYIIYAIVIKSIYNISALGKVTVNDTRMTIRVA